MQLQGSKRWRLGPALEIQNAATIHGSYNGYVNASSWKPWFSVVLHAGDAILFPTSFLHETEGLGDASTCGLSITHQFEYPIPGRYMNAYLPRLLLSPALRSCAIDSQAYSIGSL